MSEGQSDQHAPKGTSITSVKQGKVLIDLAVGGGQFVYSLTDESGQDLVGQTPEDGFYLRVAEKTDTTFELYLSPDKDWRFDQPALTLKKSSCAKYYKVDVDPADPRHITLHATSTGLPPQSKGKPGEIQAYNLHVVMAQPGGSAISVRIDPDIKNPPPAGG